MSLCVPGQPMSCAATLLCLCLWHPPAPTAPSVAVSSTYKLAACIIPCLLSATALLPSPFLTTCLTLVVIRRYSSLLSALGGPLVPPSPAAAVALVGHLSNMRNDQSRLRAAAAVVGAGSLTASGHFRVLEAAACAGAPRLLLPLHHVTRLHPLPCTTSLASTRRCVSECAGIFPA